MYSLDGLHLFFVCVFSIRASDLSVGAIAARGLLVARCRAVCFEKPEGSIGAGQSKFILTEDGLFIEVDRKVKFG